MSMFAYQSDWMNSESRFQKTFSDHGRPVQKGDDACVPRVAARLSMLATCRGHPGTVSRVLSTPRACPTHSPALVRISSPPPRAAPSKQPLRHCRSCFTVA